MKRLARPRPPSRVFGVLRAPRFRNASSFVRGSTQVPLLEDTFPQYFAKTLLQDQHARTPALISVHEPASAHGGPLSSLNQESGRKHLAWSFEDMDRHVAALSRGMLQLGIGRGDRVGIVMGNSSAYAALQWACGRIGAIAVTINPAYKITEMIGAMSLAGVSTLFISPRLRSSDYISLLQEHLPTFSSSHETVDPSLPSLKSIVLVDNISHSPLHSSTSSFHPEKEKIRGAIDYRDLLVWREDGPLKGQVDGISASLDADEVVNLQFTSGTTGAPKAVSLTHRNLLNNGFFIGECMHLTPKDKVCNVPPLFHCFGNLGSWTHGSTVVYPAETYDPLATLHAIELEKCTAVHGVPTHFLGLLSEIEKRQREVGEKWDLGSLRTGIAAGSTVPIDLMKQLIGKLNLHELTIAYGMTETSPVSFQTIPSDPMEKRTETVGRIQPHLVAKVVDPEGHIVDVGKPGELCVSGYSIHKGYWNDPEHSSEVLKRERDPDGKHERDWIYTGDQAILDEDGYIKIVGRIKDIIIRGGENLFPVQIENVLTDHPEIREAAAVAVPDAKYGEAVGVFLVREPSVEESNGDSTSSIQGVDVKAWVAKQMNPQNAPAFVWFLDENEIGSRGFIELPKTGSGKVQKNILREWAKGLAGDGVGLVSKPVKGAS